MLEVKLLPKQVVPLDAGPIWSMIRTGRGSGKTFAGAYAMAQRLELGLDVDIIGFDMRYTKDHMAFEIWKCLGAPALTRSRDETRVTVVSTGATVRMWTPLDAPRFHVPRITGGTWFDDVTIGHNMGRIHYDLVQMLQAAARHGKTPLSRTVWTGEVGYPSFTDA